MQNNFNNMLKAEKLIFNKAKYGFKQQQATEFKRLLKGLNLSINSFIIQYFKENPYNENKKKVLTKKIKELLKIANIKTKVIYKENPTIKYKLHGNKTNKTTYTKFILIEC